MIPLLVGAARAAPPEAAWLKPKAPQSLLLDIAGAGDRWIVVGERGHVLVSDDAAAWEQVKAPTRVLLAAVDVNDRGLAFAVGHEATIIQSRDNGDTWSRVYHDPAEQAPFLDVMIAGRDRVVAVGAYGLYVESNDGGDTWERRVLEPEALDSAASAEEDEEFFYDFHLNDIEVADSGRWYIAAEAGTVYRSDDAGETWLRLPSPYAGSFFGVLPMDGETVMVFGLQGRLFRSGDAGANWRRVDTGTEATLSSGLRLESGGALITGYAGILLREMGAGGRVVRARLENRPSLSDARVLDSGELLSVGQGGIRRWSAEVMPRR